MECPIASWARTTSTAPPWASTPAITCIAWSNWAITSPWHRNRSRLPRTRSQALLEEALLTGEADLQPARSALHVGAGERAAHQGRTRRQDRREGLRVDRGLAASWAVARQLCAGSGAAGVAGADALSAESRERAERGD